MMTVDYSKVCGACSAPLDASPRDGAGSMCAYLHTAPGHKDFERILKGNLERKRLIDEAAESTDEATMNPNEATFSDEATVNEATEADEATIWTKEVTVDSDEATEETKSQRYKRINRERINQTQRDRRNHVRCDDDSCLICA